MLFCATFQYCLLKIIYAHWIFSWPKGAPLKLWSDSKNSDIFQISMYVSSLPFFGSEMAKSARCKSFSMGTMPKPVPSGYTVANVPPFRWFLNPTASHFDHHTVFKVEYLLIDGAKPFFNSGNILDINFWASHFGNLPSFALLHPYFREVVGTINIGKTLRYKDW